MSISPAVGNFQEVSPPICLIWGKYRERGQRRWGRGRWKSKQGVGSSKFVKECCLLRLAKSMVQEELGRSSNVSPMPHGRKGQSITKTTEEYVQRRTTCSTSPTTALETFGDTWTFFLLSRHFSSRGAQGFAGPGLATGGRWNPLGTAVSFPRTPGSK